MRVTDAAVEMNVSPKLQWTGITFLVHKENEETVMQVQVQLARLVIY